MHAQQTIAIKFSDVCNVRDNRIGYERVCTVYVCVCERECVYAK